MSEPRTRARKIQIVVAGVLNWSIRDDRIGFRSDAYALANGQEIVLIDPLPLPDKLLRGLGAVGAICLTARCHQRSAWSLRRKLKVKVYAPAGRESYEEPPDVLYGPKDRLPGSLLAVHAPGPAIAHYAFLLKRRGGVLFGADLLVNSGRGLRFVDSEYQDDPELTRRTVRKLLDLPFRTLCLNHGGAVTRGAKQAIRRALTADRLEAGQRT